MTEETLLMILLGANIIFTFINMLIIKNLMNFWTECLDTIKQVFDSNAKISKDLINASRNFINVMGFKFSEPPKDPEYEELNIVDLSKED